MPEPNLTNPEPQAPPLHAVPPKPNRAKKASCGTVAPRVTLSAELTTAVTAHVSQEVRPDLSLATFAAGVHTAIPFEGEVARRVWMESGHARAGEHAALLGRIAELETEVKSYAEELGDVIDELHRANLPPDLCCSAKNLLMLIEIDKGQTVRAIADAIQTVAYDMRSRFVPKYKGKVKVKIGCTPDPNDMDSMIVLAEVSPEMPAQATGGRLTLASDGTVATRRESAAAFQLKMIEPEPDPLVEAYGEAKGTELRKILLANDIKEITLGTGDNQVKVKLAGGRATAAKKAA